MRYEITFLVTNKSNDKTPVWDEEVNSFGDNFVEIYWCGSFGGELMGFPNDNVEVTQATVDFIKDKAKKNWKCYEERLEWLSRTAEALKPGYDNYLDDLGKLSGDIMDAEREQFNDWEFADSLISFLEKILEEGKCKVWACPSY